MCGPMEDVIFEEVLLQILDQFDEHDAATRKGVEAGTRKFHESPCVAQLTAFADGSLDDVQARRILYCPLTSDMPVYARLFAAGRDIAAKNDKEQVKLLHHMMSAFYLVHSKDEVLLQHFVAAGGALSLTVIIEGNNPYLSSQVIEGLRRIGALSCGDVNMWSLTAAQRTEWQELLYAQLCACFIGEHWFHGLIATCECGDKWPGSLQMCLELLGFSLNWLRQFSEAQVVALPPALVQLFALLLDEEALPADHGARQVIGQLQGTFPELSADEARHTSSCHRAVERQVTVPAVPDVPLSSGPADSRAQRLKALGNQAFKRQVWPRAVALYTLSIDDAPSAVVRSNRAAALLKLGDWSAAAADALAATDLEPENAKAWFRLGEARVELADRLGAQAAVDRAHALAPSKATTQLLAKVAALPAPAEEPAAELNSLD